MSDSKKEKFVSENEGKSTSISKYVEELPTWAKDAVKSCKTLRDIDDIDKDVFSKPIDELRKLHDQIPKGLYEDFVQGAMQEPKWRESPIKLTSLLKINGKPFTLSKHRFFEPMFYSDLPPRTLLVCARQVGKSTHMAAQGVLQAACLDRFKVLFLAPQFEQIRRFSHQYIKQFIEESFLRELLVDRTTMDSVLQKSFKNRSELFFSFALLSVERVRGLAVDAIRIDEIQDLQPDFLDIIRECMSASTRRSEMYAGTSKTVDNIIEQLRLQSSQAEWFMKCEVCNHWNIPTVEGSGSGLGVSAMMQPEGMCCAKCKRPIDPEKGFWVHKYPERANFFPSYHVPQVIAPVHYANKKNWKALLYKRAEMAPAKFINEILGESCDEGQRLVSKTELESASCLNENKLETAVIARGRYSDVILGVDWGGKGERLQSFTAVAVMGIRPDSENLETIYAKVYPALMDPVEETKSVVGLFHTFGASGIAHDTAVAGEIRRSIMKSIGLTDSNLYNCRYSPGMVSKNFIEFRAATEVNPTNYYNLDRNRILAAVCLAIKGKNLLFPDYDSMGNEAGKNIMDHFLAVYEETTETAHGREQKFIRRNPGMPDDFMHACGFACATLWSRYPYTQPSLNSSFVDPMSQEEVDFIEPRSYSNDDIWMD